jgi:dipeptidase E
MLVEALLLSTSTLYGQRYLQYALKPIREWLHGERELLFVPYAMADHGKYSALVAEALSPLGVQIRGLHEFPDPRAAIEGASRIFCGGGNTFRLLHGLQREGLVDVIRQVVCRGEARYLGSSAGTNIAGPTIRTTNDMPIVEPASFDSLALVPFQVNPHYLDPIPGLPHMGETRETRLNEFLEENDRAVVALREGAWLRVRSEGSITLEGHSARLFRRGAPAIEQLIGSDFSELT